ncbi:MAG: hypothetical protein V2I27_07155 [Erythrobacter sp.]|jgi:hypothetical protein|nr:hypothetical protein [Erythrobacter sp.]
MFLRKALICAVTALVLTSPLAAAPSDQAMIDAHMARWNPESVMLLGHLADCVAEKHPQTADAFVRNTSDSTALSKDQARLVDTACIKKYWLRSSRTTVDPELYRPLLGEALVTRALSAAAMPSFDRLTQGPDNPRLPDVPIGEVHPYYRSMFTVDRYLGELADHSECVARAQPQAVLALGTTKRGSAEEASAIARLDAAAPGCADRRPAVTFPSFLRRADLLLQLYLLSRLAGSPVLQRVS